MHFFLQCHITYFTSSTYPMHPMDEPIFDTVAALHGALPVFYFVLQPRGVSSDNVVDIKQQIPIIQSSH